MIWFVKVISLLWFLPTKKNILPVVKDTKKVIGKQNIKSKGEEVEKIFLRKEEEQGELEKDLKVVVLLKNFSQNELKK